MNAGRKGNGRLGEKTVRMLTHPCFAASVPGVLMRRFLRGVDKRTGLLSPHFVTALNATERPPYAYCLYNAAVLARKLGLEAMSVIEFGVAGGNGLVFLDNFAKRVQNALNLRIGCTASIPVKGCQPQSATRICRIGTEVRSTEWTLPHLNRGFRPPN